MTSKQQELGVVDSWEELDETDELERKLDQLIARKKAPESTSYNGRNWTKIDITLTGDDALRSQYVPPEPTVTILRRPTKVNQANNDMKTKSLQPKKTLKQRKREYAEARLRILGETATVEKPEERIRILIKPKQIDSENVIRLAKGPDDTKGFTIRK